MVYSLKPEMPTCLALGPQIKTQNKNDAPEHGSL